MIQEFLIISARGDTLLTKNYAGVAVGRAHAPARATRARDGRARMRHGFPCHNLWAGLLLGRAEDAPWRGARRVAGWDVAPGMHAATLVCLVHACLALPAREALLQTPEVRTARCAQVNRSTADTFLNHVNKFQPHGQARAPAAAVQPCASRQSRSKCARAAAP